MRFKRMLVFLLGLMTVFILSSDLMGASRPSTLKINYFSYEKSNPDREFWFWKLKYTDENKVYHDGATGVIKNIAWNPANTNWGSITIDLTANTPVYQTKYNDHDQYGVLLKGKTVGTNEGWHYQTPDMTFDVNDLTQTSPGVAEIWIVEGDNFLYHDQTSAQLATRHRFLISTFTEETRIKYTITNNVKPTEMKIQGANARGEVTNITTFTDTFTASNKTGIITLQSGVRIDYGLKYTITAKLESDYVAVTRPITFDGLYDTTGFSNAFTYDGDDLGAKYNPTNQRTTFKLWAPVSTSVELLIYDAGHPTSLREDGDDTPDKYTMNSSTTNLGIFEYAMSANLSGKYYTYLVTTGSSTTEVVDPYAQTTGVNGLRGMVVNWNDTNPAGWNSFNLPDFSGNAVDAIIYELHIRDLTISDSWNGSEENRGNYLGVVEPGTTFTKNGKTVKTGFDHLKELGITHLHILPVMDYPLVDETRMDDPEYIAKEEDGPFNWGYMTQYYFSLEGAYSNNPYDGYARIREYKQMIKSLAEAGIRVIMDVVYNHSAEGSGSNFNKIVPGYYHRLTADGSYKNGSGCGNEIESRRSMVRKMILDSAKLFTAEYKVSGYRFDLMGLMDVKTMNDFSAVVRAIQPESIFYGEAWDNGDLPGHEKAYHSNLNKMPTVGAFSDVSRMGYQNWGAAGGEDAYNRVVHGLVGGNKFYNSADAETRFTHVNPNQYVNYASCHDGETVYDLMRYAKGKAHAQALRLATQANALVLASQGVPFLHAGADIGRSKGGEHNSYNLSDRVNQIDWASKVDNFSTFETYQRLINIRKEHPAFRYTTTSAIQSNVDVNYQQGTTGAHNTLIFAKLKSPVQDSWGDIYVVSVTSAQSVNLGKSGMSVVYSSYGDKPLGKVAGSSVSLSANETIILASNVGVSLSTNQPNNTVTYGDSITISADTSSLGSGSHTYEWYKGTSKLAATTSSITLTNVADTGSYRVVVNGTNEASINVTIQARTPSVSVSYEGEQLTTKSDLTAIEFLVDSGGVEGEFELLDTVPKEGINSYRYRFTPDDVNYRIVEGTIQLDIEVKTITDVKVISEPDKLEYDAKDAVDLEGLTVQVTYSDGSKEMSTDYTTSVSIVHYGDSVIRVYYDTFYFDISITVHKITPIITNVRTIGPLFEGMLPIFAFTGPEGEIKLIDPEYLQSSITDYEWKYTSTDADYEEVTGIIQLRIEPKEPVKLEYVNQWGKTDYTAKELVDLAGFAFTVSFSDGTQLLIDDSSDLRLDRDIVYGSDTFIAVYYANIFVLISIEVTKISLVEDVDFVVDIPVTLDINAINDTVTIKATASSLVLGSMSINGPFELGTHNYAYTYIPNDLLNYSAVVGYVDLTLIDGLLSEKEQANQSLTDLYDLDLYYSEQQDVITGLLSEAQGFIIVAKTNIEINNIVASYKKMLAAVQSKVVVDAIEAEQQITVYALALTTSYLNKLSDYVTRTSLEITTLITAFLDDSYATKALLDDAYEDLVERLAGFKKKSELLYTISFFDFDKVLIETFTLAYGSLIVPPDVIDIPDMVFVGWNRTFTTVVDNLDIEAVYQVNTIRTLDSFILINDGIAKANYSIEELSTEGYRTYYDGAEWDAMRVVLIKVNSSLKNASRIEFVLGTTDDLTDSYQIVCITSKEVIPLETIKVGNKIVCYTDVYGEFALIKTVDNNSSAPGASPGAMSTAVLGAASFIGFGILFTLGRKKRG